MPKILPQESPETRPSTMRAAHVTEWCAVGSVPDSIVLGEIPAPPPPLKREVVIGVRATAINVDDIAGLQAGSFVGLISGRFLVKAIYWQISILALFCCR